MKTLQELATRVDNLELAIGSKLDAICSALGVSPDAATGVKGSGMRGQLASLVEAEEARRAAETERLARRAKLVAAVKVIGGSLSAVGAFVGFLKALGVI